MLTIVDTRRRHHLDTYGRSLASCEMMVKRPPKRVRLTEQDKQVLRQHGFAPNPQTLGRLIKAARRRRAATLIDLGTPRTAAERQMHSEFAEYDRFECHPSGWVRMAGMNFYPEYDKDS